MLIEFVLIVKKVLPKCYVIVKEKILKIILKIIIKIKRIKWRNY